MKQFISKNRYSVMTATAMLLFTCLVFVFAVKNNVAKAGIPAKNIKQPESIWVVANGKGIYQVTFHTNADGVTTHSCEQLFDENGK